MGHHIKCSSIILTAHYWTKTFLVLFLCRAFMILQETKFTNNKNPRIQLERHLCNPTAHAQLIEPIPSFTETPTTYFTFSFKFRQLNSAA